MRQIILDTETTGIGPEKGHRVIEIGCVELIERKLTGNHFHVYLNPERLVDEGAFRVHGISDAFLKDKPLFASVVSEFIQFIDGAEVIAHNASFDVSFLNSELKHVGWKKKFENHCQVFDTLAYARDKFPGQRNSLDALCKRFGIDHFNRELHGALLDAEILAYVYLAMTGGQSSLFVETEVASGAKQQKIVEINALKSMHSIVLQADASELEAHQAFLNFLVKKSGINHWEEKDIQMIES